VSKQQYERPDLDQYFINVMEATSARATCDRGRAAAVIVVDGHIVSTGYVGAPAGLAHCDDADHMMRIVVDPKSGRRSEHCVRTVHAEQNAICQAAKLGHAVKGGALYCRMEPCHVCAMLIINCGIKRVVAQKRYHAAEWSREMFAQAGVELTVLEDDVQEYENSGAE
jgi:dCMP deaminase